jgi:hypothetical protein
MKLDDRAHQPCPICGYDQFTFGDLKTSYKLFFEPYQPPAINRFDTYNSGKRERVVSRRCIACGNIQTFSLLGAKPATKHKRKPRR